MAFQCGHLVRFISMCYLQRRSIQVWNDKWSLITKYLLVMNFPKWSNIRFEKFGLNINLKLNPEGTWIKIQVTSYLRWLIDKPSIFFAQDMQGMWSNSINLPIVPWANYHACEALLLKRCGILKGRDRTVTSMGCQSVRSKNSEAQGFALHSRTRMS